MAKVSLAEDGRVAFWCPGCEVVHMVTTPKLWSFNDDTNRPTLNPSILVRGGSAQSVCHSFVEDGHIRYLNDSTHRLSGQTVSLPDWPFGTE